MIMPNKFVHPSDSLLFISKFVLESLQSHDSDFEDLFESVCKKYPKDLSIEKFILSINFLYITGRIEKSNEIIKAKFRQ
ncbi:ABC-three component system middle component 6 [Vibrio jasicida]|uniref:ABC-three component system middle component 6 n=1 Tax=Vibrio jasicida TaxID=766224 RepID=UPI003456B26B